MPLLVSCKQKWRSLGSGGCCHIYWGNAHIFLRLPEANLRDFGKLHACSFSFKGQLFFQRPTLSHLLLDSLRIHFYMALWFKVLYMYIFTESHKINRSICMTFFALKMSFLLMVVTARKLYVVKTVINIPGVCFSFIEKLM